MFRPISHKVFLASFLLLLSGSEMFSACSSKRIYPTRASSGSIETTSALININTADTVQLETLPHVGRKLAEKIVEHRNRYGPFRKPEHLLVIDGVSEERFRDIIHLIAIE